MHAIPYVSLTVVCVSNAVYMRVSSVSAFDYALAFWYYLYIESAIGTALLIPDYKRAKL